jgi:hypothetical protein
VTFEVLQELERDEDACWEILPDSGGKEGLSRRLVRAGREALSLEDFYTRVKTKRYSLARIRRLTLWAFLGLTSRDFLPFVPYIRVLACNETGRRVLHERKKTSRLPMITQGSRGHTLEGAAKDAFAREAANTDLYHLCRGEIVRGGEEWRQGPILL